MYQIQGSKIRLIEAYQHIDILDIWPLNIEQGNMK